MQFSAATIGYLLAALVLGVIGSAFLVASFNLAMQLQDPDAIPELQVSFVIALTLGLLLVVPAYRIGRRGVRRLRDGPPS